MTFSEDESVEANINMFQDDLELFVYLWVFTFDNLLDHLAILHDLLNVDSFLHLNMIVVQEFLTDLHNAGVVGDMNICHRISVKLEVLHA